MTKTWRAAVAMTVLTVAVAGCATATGSAVAAVDPPAAGAGSAPVTQHDGWTVGGALALLPATALPAGEAFVTVGDLVGASGHAGVEHPAGAAGSITVLEWASAVSAPRADATVAALLPEVAQPASLALADDFRAEVGWNLADVETFAEITAPPDRFSVLTGPIDEADLTAAMGTPVEGVWSVGPDVDGRQDLAGRTVARPLGEGLRTASADGAVAVSRATAPLRQWVAGGGRTLAEDPSLAALAAALDEREVYAAVLVPDATDAVGEHAALAPFGAMAVGLAVEDGVPVLVVAYRYDTAAAAAGDVATLTDLVRNGAAADGRPWADRLDVGEVSAEGAVLTGSFTVHGPPSVAWQLIATRDALATHR
ncbi:hypothetical protein [Nakamurella deserti]|uniref:hypothetical protein n=1 Tax=Nakamurella deserti TaxID=2164074 RepID=UPI000DBE8F2A|nr:hypothetical protein [Nakamurella deserti]